PALCTLSLHDALPILIRDELLAQRRRLRDERSRSIVGEIQTWALAQRALPQSSVGRAIGYLLGLWTGLTRFLDDPRIPLDNNLRSEEHTSELQSPDHL